MEPPGPRDLENENIVYSTRLSQTDKESFKPTARGPRNGKTKARKLACIPFQRDPPELGPHAYTAKGKSLIQQPPHPKRAKAGHIVGKYDQPPFQI